MDMSVKSMIAKFSGLSTMKIAEIGPSEQYLATKDWHQRFTQMHDCWEQRCSGQTPSSMNVQKLIKMWQARGA